MPILTQKSEATTCVRKLTVDEQPHVDPNIVTMSRVRPLGKQQIVLVHITTDDGQVRTFAYSPEQLVIVETDTSQPTVSFALTPEGERFRIADITLRISRSTQEELGLTI